MCMVVDSYSGILVIEGYEDVESSVAEYGKQKEGPENNDTVGGDAKIPLAREVRVIWCICTCGC